MFTPTLITPSLSRPSRARSAQHLARTLGLACCVLTACDDAELAGETFAEPAELDHAEWSALMDAREELGARAQGGQWIVRFRAAEPLQQTLTRAELERELEQGALTRFDASAVHEPLRLDIEQVHVREGQARVAALAERHGLALTHLRVLGNGADLVELDADAESLVELLREDPEVEYVEPDAELAPNFVPSDSMYSWQWHYHDHSYSRGINMEWAWGWYTGSGAVVAVVDTGGTPHWDLDANTLPGYDFISSAWRSRDGDGRDADPHDMGDYASGGECLFNPAQDSTWHGTHVAGTIAAVVGNEGGVGVAFNAKVFHARALGLCGGTMSDVVDAIIWSAGGAVTGVPENANPADVINLSLGDSWGIGNVWPGGCPATLQAGIDSAHDAGAAVVVGAGNDDSAASSYFPANCNNVITVAASDRDGSRAPYSNYGAGVDVTAPGGTSNNGVVSTIHGSSTTWQSGGQYQVISMRHGTSLAAAHVSGVAALLRNRSPDMTPAQIEARLVSTARPMSCSEGCGAGLVDAYAAVFPF